MTISGERRDKQERGRGQTTYLSYEFVEAASSRSSEHGAELWAAAPHPAVNCELSG